MLSALLVGSLTASVLATVALFATPARHSTGGAVPWSRRLLFAVAGTALLAAAAWAAAFYMTDRQSSANVAFVAVALASAVWIPLTRRWNARAHLCWATNLLLYVAYLAFMLHWTFESPLGWAGRTGALLLWVLEVFAGLLAGAYLWELCDALGSEHWRRRSRSGVDTGVVPDAQPFVSLHVPAHEEPPEMVIETLRSLLAIDYPNYEIVAIDDNTSDESLWRPVEKWCAEHGVTFAHLEDWPGYKSGALNYALRELTDPRAEVIGIVDSDYQISPDFLARCAPLFADEKLGFVQSPQDYRDWEHATFLRRLYYSYKYFFSISPPSRNERDGAIFAGTMGLIRRPALESVGGWDEWCITEDAELSLRLLRDGWSGLHVDRSYGHGVMPLTFEALKGQRFRWCFGGIQILRMHWRSMLPGFLGRRQDGKQNRLTGGQRWAYLSGALQWYGDLVGVVFFFFLLGGALNIALGGGLLFRKLSAFLLAAIPLLVVLGFVRAVALIRRGTGASWHDAIGAFLIWQSTSLVVARASVQALFAKKAEFLRTPKTSEKASVWKALSANKAEVLLALLGLVGIAIGVAHVTSFSGVLTAALLVIPTISFAAAPWHSLMAQRASLPPEMARRRATESRRAYYTRGAAAAGTGLVLAGAVVALALLLLGTGGDEVGPPRLRPEPAAQSEGPQSPTREPTGDQSSEQSSEPTPTETSEPSSETPTEATSEPTSEPTSAPTSEATPGVETSATP